VLFDKHFGHAIYGCNKISWCVLKTPHRSMHAVDGVTYFTIAISYMFIKLTTRANVIRLFMAASYAFSKLARAFVPGKPFQLILMFAVKAKAYPSEAPSRCSSLS
jgi:hypothetical protein